MNILDIIILICLAVALIQGFRNGFISQAISIISIIVGFWASAHFATCVSDWIGQYFSASEQVLRIVAFALILIAAFTVLGIIGRILEATIKFVLLGWVNRVLGMVFSIMKGILILGLIIIAFESINNLFGLVSPEKLAQSALYPVILDIANWAFPYLKSLLALK